MFSVFGWYQHTDEGRLADGWYCIATLFQLLISTVR